MIKYELSSLFVPLERLYVYRNFIYETDQEAGEFSEWHPDMGDLGQYSFELLNQLNNIIYKLNSYVPPTK